MILFLSLFVNNALVCMCKPTVSHCSSENVVGCGVLWQRWQFSPHSWAPDFAATFALSLQLFIDNRLNRPKQTAIATDNMLVLVVFIKLCFRTVLKIVG